MKKQFNDEQRAVIAEWWDWRVKKERGILDMVRARAVSAGMGGKFSVGRISNKVNLIKLIF